MGLKKFWRMKKLTRKGKALFLAYDQGLEHGPSDFNDKNVNPLYILDIAKKGKYNAVIFQKGIAQKYYNEIKKSKVPLILKLNGKTNLVTGDPMSEKLCSVKEAIELGATAVGYTIYIGSKYEAKMLEDFEDIEEDAHEAGLPVIAWIYPRGSGLKNKNPKKLMAYATRVGLELGADIIKIKWEGSKEDLAWAVKTAGKAKVVVAGGIKTKEKKFLIQVKEIMSTGAIGLAIGRNIWQDKDPIKLTEKIKKIIWKKK
jgi:fructose-bisphosphate aldolase, class I